VALRIGLDFDGTIADITWAKLRYARETFGVEMAPEATWGTAGREVLGEERYAQLVEAVHGTSFSVEMPPMPGAVETMRRLREHHELYIVTARLDHEAELAHEWLERHGVQVDGFFHTCRTSKASHCLDLGLSVHLDDSPVVLEDLGDTLPALIDAPYNRAQPRHERVRMVEHWRAFEVLVESMAVGVVR
jgi:5'(3')-deoxyribonucleotidase